MFFLFLMATMNRKIFMTLYYIIHMFPLTENDSPSQVLCAISSHFLDALYIIIMIM